MIMPIIDIFANEFLRGSRYTKQTEPTATMPRKSDSCIVYISNDDARFTFALVGLWFRMYVA